MDIDEEDKRRERDWDDEQGVRRVRHQNAGVRRSESFLDKVPIDREHITIKRSVSAGVNTSTRLNPNAPIMTLQNLIQEGPQNQGFIVAMIMCINTESSTNKVEIQKRYNGNIKGTSTQVRYNRRIIFMCLNSDPGTNMFVMFQGNSKNQNIFDADLLLRDNGGISKFSY